MHKFHLVVGLDFVIAFFLLCISALLLKMGIINSQIFKNSVYVIVVLFLIDIWWQSTRFTKS